MFLFLIMEGSWENNMKLISLLSKTTGIAIERLRELIVKDEEMTIGETVAIANAFNFSESEYIENFVRQERE